MTEELVVLVDPEDRELERVEKLEAHRKGLLHRAVSVFLLDDGGRMLLQKRAEGKYHSEGLWSNACCSHPRPGESPRDAAHRRTREELGLQCELEPAFTFIYRAELDRGLTEHELDHVFVGVAGRDPEPDPEEVSDWRWVEIQELQRELRSHPERFTAWFPIALQRLLEAQPVRG